MTVKKIYTVTKILISDDPSREISILISCTVETVYINNMLSRQEAWQFPGLAVAKE